jgi:hypothetical protein
MLVAGSLWQELTEGAPDEFGGLDTENRLGRAGRCENVVVGRKQDNRVRRLSQHRLKPPRFALISPTTRRREPALVEGRQRDDQGWGGGCPREAARHVWA